MHARQHGFFGIQQIDNLGKIGMYQFRTCAGDLFHCVQSPAAHKRIRVQQSFRQVGHQLPVLQNSLRSLVSRAVRA